MILAFVQEEGCELPYYLAALYLAALCSDVYLQTLSIFTILQP